MRVAFFVTCLTDTFFPRVGLAAVRVLRHFGCEVVFPAAQTCCGQPAYNSGFHREARELARRMVTVFAEDLPVVTPSASCAAMVQRHLPELLAADAAWHERALGLAGRTHEILRFLSGPLGVNIAALLSPAEPFSLHFPCHARGVHAPSELAAWCAHGGGAHFRPAQRAEMCCGFGGLFANEQPEISGGMLAEKLADLEATGASLVVCNEGGCALQLLGGAHRAGHALRCRHIIELIAEMLGVLDSP